MKSPTAMRKFSARSAFAALLFALCTLPASAQDLPTDLAGARTVVKDFAGSLRNELVQALEAGGPTAAINVCREAAPAIAAEKSAKTGWDVGRTSLKLRNPANAPDDWERQTLRSFEERRAAGEDPAQIEFSEEVAENGRRVWRYMKAIPTGEPCLACHGTAIAPEVAETLKRVYPDDQATGFRLGDIRGAFTIKQPL